jgi:hypothetical protein
MASVLESTIVTAIVQALKSVPGLVVRKRWGNAMGFAGDPDLSGCYQGRHFELEVKVPGGRLTKLQLERLREWRSAGALTGVVGSVREALEVLGIAPRASAFHVRPDISPGWETAETQHEKLPARGARRPNADEQAGDWGD